MATVPIELGETDVVLRWVIAQPGACVKEPLEGRGVLATFGMQQAGGLMPSLDTKSETVIDTIEQNAQTAVRLQRSRGWLETDLPCSVFLCAYDLWEYRWPKSRERASSLLVTPIWYQQLPQAWIEQVSSGGWVLHSPGDSEGKAAYRATKLARQFAKETARVEARASERPEVDQHVELSPELTRRGYDRMFETVQRAIREGDYYLANLAQRFLSLERGSTRLKIDRGALYSRLRRMSPSPHGCFVRFGQSSLSLLSSSPERLYRVGGGQDAQGCRVVETCPIKGTRQVRGESGADGRARHELQNDPKERAELSMIIDLERNDLGRLCKTGSVEVIDPYRIESFAQVHHMVATVRGLLPESAWLGALIKEGFPGGSVTGAPKLAVMEALRSIERGQRGTYCGSIFWIGADQSIDSNILIRTILHSHDEAHGDFVTTHTGGGITIDSDCDREYRECFHKLMGMATALEPWLDVTKLRRVAEGALNEYDVPSASRPLSEAQVGGTE